jgi:hypothetical protein
LEEKLNPDDGMMAALGTFAEEGIVADDVVVVVGQQMLECQHLNCRNPSAKVDDDADQLEGEIGRNKRLR